MTELQLNATLRSENGKSSARRLRHDQKIPAIVYGADKEPQPLSLNHHEVIKALENEEFFSQIIKLNFDGKNEQVVIKDLQRHPFKPKITHIDFLRIKASEQITMLIPLHFINEEQAPGIKQGGIVSHALSEVEIKCLPADLPKFIAVDMEKVALDETIHLSDLKLPKGVELTTLAQDGEHDQLVATIHTPRAVVEEEAPQEEVAEETTTEEETEASKE